MRVAKQRYSQTPGEVINEIRKMVKILNDMIYQGAFREVEWDLRRWGVHDTLTGESMPVHSRAEACRLIITMGDTYTLVNRA